MHWSTPNYQPTIARRPIKGTYRSRFIIPLQEFVGWEIFPIVYIASGLDVPREIDDDTLHQLYLFCTGSQKPSTSATYR